MPLPSNKEIKAVIFDFGGVFTTSPVANFAVFEKENDLPKNFLGGVIKQNHHTNAWAQFERSEIDLETFHHAFATETEKAGHKVTGRTLLSLLTLQLREEMINALMAVKAAGYKTGCITNNMPGINSEQMVYSSQDQLRAAEILTEFDHVIESSKVGLRKPEPRIYEMMCETLGVTAHQCVFLDDLGINLKPAMAMGMTTIKVSINDVRPAIADLKALLNLD